jgi:hypothetical protein
MDLSLSRAHGALAFVAVFATGCIIDSRNFSSPQSYDSDDGVCESRYGGEGDHVVGERWFFNDELCRCVNVAGEAQTDCVYLCDQRDVRFMDSDGVVCSCDDLNRVECAADGNDTQCDCLCSDPDDDGVCDDE